MAGKVFFVTGIDTNVGKTFISLLILLALKSKGLNAGYMKPVETGVKIKGDGSKNYLDGLYIKNVAGLKDPIESIVPYTFEAPLAPYAASKLEGKPLCIKEILDKFYDFNTAYEYMIVEGAGGMLVPLKKGHFMIDIATYIDASVILVTKAGLGMINQTLLNIEYAKGRGIKIAGIVINNGLNENDESVISNKNVLAEFTDIKVIGDVPFMGSGLDNAEKLEEFALKHIDIDKILM